MKIFTTAAVLIATAFLLAFCGRVLFGPTGYKYRCEGFNEAVAAKWTQDATMPAATLENAREAAAHVGGVCTVTKMEFK